GTSAIINASVRPEVQGANASHEEAITMKEHASFGPIPPGDFERIREVFEAALEATPDERSAFVEKACGGNVLLIGEVQRMLAGQGEHNSLLDGTPLAGPRLP